MNPFFYGSAVTGDAFIGRHDQIEDLRNKILSGQNVVLYGERRMGKTSLAAEVFRQISKSHDAVFVDLNNVKTVKDVIFSISGAVHRLSGRGRPKEVARNLWRGLKSARPKHNWLPTDGSPSLSLTFEEQMDSIDEMFAHIEGAHKEKPLVIFLDEFQGVLKCENSDRLIALLRSHIQHQPNIPYLFAGSIRHQMYDIFMSPISPFFKSAIPMEIGPIPKEELCQSLAGIFSRENTSVAVNGTLEFAYDLVHGTTGEMQQICSTIWDILPHCAPVDMTSLEKGIKKILTIYDKHYSAIYRKLTIKQADVLKELARVNGKEPYCVEFQNATGQPLGTIQKGIKKLEKEEVIYQPYGEKDYRFIDPFFQAWVIQDQIGLDLFPQDEEPVLVPHNKRHQVGPLFSI